MLLVPEAGLPDLRAVALVPKPGGGGWVARCTVEIAQETDTVAFDVRPLTSRARVVVNSQPQERHPTDDAADQVFQRALGVACLAVGGTALAPCVDTVGWLPTHERRLAVRWGRKPFVVRRLLRGRGIRGAAQGAQGGTGGRRRLALIVGLGAMVAVRRRVAGVAGCRGVAAPPRAQRTHPGVSRFRRGLTRRVDALLREHLARPLDGGPEPWISLARRAPMPCSGSMRSIGATATVAVRSSRSRDNRTPGSPSARTGRSAGAPRGAACGPRRGRRVHLSVDRL